MSSVRKVPTKLGYAWQARWRERGRACAKTFDNKKGAKAYATRMADTVENRGVGDAERLTTGAYLIRFADEVAADSEYSPATVACYRKMTALADRVLGKIPLARLTTSAVDDGYAALLTGTKPLARSTVRLLHRVLVAALARAVRRGLLPFNPATNASPARKVDEGRKIRVFCSEEVAALLTAAAADPAPDMLAIVSLLLATGVRRSELLGLTLDDVDTDQGLLHVRGTVIEVNGKPVARPRGKSAAALRTLALPPTVTALLRTQRARVQEMMLAAGVRAPAYLFPLSPRQMTERLKRLMLTAGIRDSRSPCHTWRHTSGTLTFDATTNVKLVQARLGHASAAITMQLYVHSMVEREREAATHFERLLSANKT